MTANASVIWSAQADVSSDTAPVGYAMTLASNGLSMVVATTANLAASPSGVVECVAVTPVSPGLSFVGQVDGRLSPAQAPFVAAGTLNPYATVDALGRIVRAASYSALTVGVCGRDGSVSLCLALFGGLIGAGGGPTAPVVSSISPPVWWRRTGGLPVTITGTGFVSGAAATVGGVAFTSVVVVNSTTITAVTPTLGSDGLFDVVVTNPSAQSGTLVLGYRAHASVAWWRGDLNSSIVLDGSNVDILQDQSDGGTFDLSQDGAGNGPTVSAGAIGSLQALNYAGGKWLRLLANPFAAGAAYTLLNVAKGGNGALLTLRRAFPYSANQILVDSGTTYTFTDGVGGFVANDACPEVANAFKSVHVHPDRVAANQVLRVNGVVKNILSSGALTQEAGADGVEAGTNQHSQKWNGLIGEQVLLAGAAAAGVIASFEAYTIARGWGA